MYGESHNLIQDAGKAEHFEAMAAYVFDFGLRPNVAYVHARDNNNTDLTEYVALGTDYYFNKNMVADVGYKINLLDGKDGDQSGCCGSDLSVLSSYTSTKKASWLRRLFYICWSLNRLTFFHLYTAKQPLPDAHFYPCDHAEDQIKKRIMGNGNAHDFH